MDDFPLDPSTLAVMSERDKAEQAIALLESAYELALEANREDIARHIMNAYVLSRRDKTRR